MCLTGFAVGWIEYSLCNFIQFGNYRIHFRTCALLSSPDAVCDKCALARTRILSASLDHWPTSVGQSTNILTCNRLTLSMTGFADDTLILSTTLFNLVTSESLFMHTLTCQRSPTVLGVYKEYRLCILLHVSD